MKRKKQISCCVPGCNTSYRNRNSQSSISIFSVPTSPRLRQQWEKNLQMGEKSLTVSSAVCELHFSPKSVKHDYVHVINGREVRTARARPLLAAGAVPSDRRQLTAAPEHATGRHQPVLQTVHPNTIHERAQGGCEQVKRKCGAAYQPEQGFPSKAPRVDHQGRLESNEQFEQIGEVPPRPYDVPEADALRQIRTPSGWTKLSFPNFDGVCCATAELTEDKEIYHDSHFS